MEKVAPNVEEINSRIEIAIQDVRLARKHLDPNDPDEWNGTYNAALSAVLQAGTALLNNKGYRPKRRGDYFAIIQCVAILYPMQFPTSLLAVFEKARQRRNTAGHFESGTTSFSQAETIVAKAEEFIDIAIRTLGLSFKKR